MPIEQITNNPTLTFGTLTSTITNSQTAISVTGGATAPYPTTGSGTSQFRVLVEAEIMVVTAGQGTTNWTVTRGDGGSTPVTHGSGAQVIPILTNEALQNLANNFWPYFDPASVTGATAAVRYFGGTVSGPPTTGTWVQGDVTSDQTGNWWQCNSGGTPGTWINMVTGNTLTVNAAAHTYTTTWTTSGGGIVLGNGTLVAAYQLIGKLLFFQIKLSLGSTTSGGTGTWRFTFPPGCTADRDQTVPVKAGCNDGAGGLRYYIGFAATNVGLNYVDVWLPQSGSITIISPMNQTNTTGNIPATTSAYPFINGCNLSIVGTVFIQ